MELLDGTMWTLAGILVGSTFIYVLYDACTWLSERASDRIARELAWYWALVAGVNGRRRK